MVAELIFGTEAVKSTFGVIRGDHLTVVISPEFSIFCAR